MIESVVHYENFNEVRTVVIINYILTYYLAVCFEYLENVGRTNPRLRIVLVHISTIGGTEFLAENFFEISFGLMISMTLSNALGES